MKLVGFKLFSAITSGGGKRGRMWGNMF